jgi:hypothetical protein
VIDATLGWGEFVLFAMNLIGGYIIGKSKGYAEGWIDGLGSESPKYTFWLIYDEDSCSIKERGPR